jgi:hypothetical protein
MEPTGALDIVCVSQLPAFTKQVRTGLLPGPLGAALAAARHGGAPRHGTASDGSGSRPKALQRRAAAAAAAAAERRQQRLLLGPPLPAVDALVQGVQQQLEAFLARQRAPTSSSMKAGEAGGARC